jgi:predicted nucleotidyltransferase
MNACATRSVNEIGRRLEPVLRRRGVLKAIVFGSYARGTQDRRSDLDLILVVRTEKRFFERYDEIEGLYECLKGIPADILIYTPEELDRMADRPFIRRALEEGVVIHEQREEPSRSPAVA